MLTDWTTLPLHHTGADCTPVLVTEIDVRLDLSCNRAGQWYVRGLLLDGDDYIDGSTQDGIGGCLARAAWAHFEANRDDIMVEHGLLDVAEEARTREHIRQFTSVC